MKNSSASSAPTELKEVVAEPALEFPDWSGMDRSPRKIDVNTACWMSEQYYSLLQQSGALRRTVEKVTVEFVL